MVGTKKDQLIKLASSKNLKFVGHRGNTASPVCVVGEAPGADEDACGLPFMGYAGQQLDGQLAEVGLTDVWYTNPYHIRPPGNDLEARHVWGIPDDLEIGTFLEDLRQHKPTFIVTCGATPTSILCPDTVSRRDNRTHISNYKGSLLRSPLLDWEHYVIPNLHPAFILREYSERVYAILTFDRVKEELQFYENYGKIQPLPERELIDDPTADDVITYLHEAIAVCDKLPISHDIENPFYKRVKIPYVFNFSFDRRRAISFNLFDYPLSKLVIIWRLMDDLLRRAAKLVGQNYLNYDSVYQEESVGLFPNIAGLHDTMTRHKILWPEFPHTLDFQVFQYTREPFFKEEGRRWNPKEGKRILRRYGCKDAACTLEVFEEQENELIARNLKGFYENIEMPLARRLHWVEKRGVLANQKGLDALRKRIDSELERICKEATATVGKPVFPSKEKADAFVKFAKKAGKKLEKGTVFNIASPSQVVGEFERLGIYLPSEDGKVKADEEALQKSLAKTGSPLPKLVLESRGLNKLLGTYVNAVLLDDTLYTSYISTGTVNGRRSSGGYHSDTIFEYGTNMQNLPKHGKGIIHDFQEAFRECLVARPGKIFLACDQKSAEDWMVQGIIKDQGGSAAGFDELIAGLNRHKKLAGAIFSIPEWGKIDKNSLHYFLGKKTRHAGNYDMQAFRFAIVLAKEGFHVPEKCRSCRRGKKCAKCETNTTDLLNFFHEYDPGIKQIFHRYVQEKLETTRTLVNPFGRERIFFGLHPHRDNTKVFKEAYSTLPQSTVSDNTAQAEIIIEDEWPGVLIKDDHDAVTLEIPDTPSALLDGLLLLDRAFDREIRLEKGLAFRIPIEFEIGYNLKTMKSVTRENILEIRENLIAATAN